LTGKQIVLDVNVPPETYQILNQPYEEPPVDSITDGLSAATIGNEADPEKAGGEKKKKKKKKKSKNKGISGFEDNYADAPITPEEFAEERGDIYHPSRSFAERIEFAVQRYRARRKFDNLRKDIFDKYLSLGGIETGPKMFSGGFDQRNIDDKDAEQIATMTATDAVDIDKQDGSKWKVDFEGVARAFLYVRPALRFDQSATNSRYIITVPAVRPSSGSWKRENRSPIVPRSSVTSSTTSFTTTSAPSTPMTSTPLESSATVPTMSCIRSLN
jgi:hypothetical protein